MSDIDRVAEAIYKSCHSEWRGFIPHSIELKYRRMAEAAITAMELKQETGTLADGYGGMAISSQTGETTTYSRPNTRVVRWVGRWEVCE